MFKLKAINGSWFMTTLIDGEEMTVEQPTILECFEELEHLKNYTNKDDDRLIPDNTLNEIWNQLSYKYMYIQPQPNNNILAFKTNTDKGELFNVDDINVNLSKNLDYDITYERPNEYKQARLTDIQAHLLCKGLPDCYEYLVLKPNNDSQVFIYKDRPDIVNWVYSEDVIIKNLKEAGIYVQKMDVPRIKGRFWCTETTKEGHH